MRAENPINAFSLFKLNGNFKKRGMGSIPFLMFESCSLLTFTLSYFSSEFGRLLFEIVGQKQFISILGGKR